MWSISGSGNVAIYANQKATELGGKVIAMYDSNGYIVRRKRHRLRDHSGDQGSQARPHQDLCGSGPVLPSMLRAAAASGASPADIMRSPAQRRTRSMQRLRKQIVANGALGVLRGRKHALHPRGNLHHQVRRTALQPRQGCQRRRRCYLRSGDEPELRSGSAGPLRKWMQSSRASSESIYTAMRRGRREIRHGRRYLQAGANIAGFLKVADAMLAQGVC